jgi:hypothetical protein
MLPFALVCLIGCGGPSIDGKYNLAADGMPPGSSLVLEFKGGNFTQVLDAENMGIKIHVDTTGTYTYDGKKLVMTEKEVKVDDSKLPAQLKAAIKSQVEASKGKVQTSDVKIEGDKIMLTSEGKTATLTKVK